MTEASTNEEVTQAMPQTRETSVSIYSDGVPLLHTDEQLVFEMRSPDPDRFSGILPGFDSSARRGSSGGGGGVPSETSGLWGRIRDNIQKELLLSTTIAGVVVGLVLGAALNGHVSTAAVELIGFPGEIFLRGLKLLVLPLICTSIFSGVLALGANPSLSSLSQQPSAEASAETPASVAATPSPQQPSRDGDEQESPIAFIAKRTVLFYIATTAIAVIIGVGMVSAFQPGQGADLSVGGACRGGEPAAPPAGPNATAPPGPPMADPAIAAVPHTTVQDALLGVVRKMVPQNLFQALAEANVLGVISVTVAVGLAVATGPAERARTAQAWAAAANDVVTRLVTAFLWGTPPGIASLIAAQIAGACSPLQIAAALARFVAVYAAGLLLHAGVVMPAMTMGMTAGKVSPLGVMKAAIPAMTCAFATDSSTATLPVTLACVKDRLAVQPNIALFVVPLGATVNMNGTALYEALAVLFIAQAHGMNLGWADTLVVALTSTLAAVGAAAIPSAGLVTMVMVLQAVNMGAYTSDIALLLALDWLLDRWRTMVNVLGDVYAAAVVDYWAAQAS